MIKENKMNKKYYSALKSKTLKNNNELETSVEKILTSLKKELQKNKFSQISLYISFKEDVRNIKKTFKLKPTKDINKTLFKIITEEYQKSNPNNYQVNKIAISVNKLKKSNKIFNLFKKLNKEANYAK